MLETNELQFIDGNDLESHVTNNIQKILNKWEARSGRSLAKESRLGADALNDNATQGYMIFEPFDCQFKSVIAILETPIFSLKTGKDLAIWKWASLDGKKTITVTPGGLGRATLRDKDIVIYCTSQLMAAINAGKKSCQKVRFQAHDFFLATGRSEQGDDYRRLLNSLDRLVSTQILTNIATGKKEEKSSFSIIESWSVVKSNGRMAAIEMKLSDWIFRAIEAKEVLTISNDYFLLRKSLDRRLYEIARKHVGKQGFWEIGIEGLRKKSGSLVVQLRQFKAELRRIEIEGCLPDYRLMLTSKGNVRFYSNNMNNLALAISKSK